MPTRVAQALIHRGHYSLADGRGGHSAQEAGCRKWRGSGVNRVGMFFGVTPACVLGCVALMLAGHRLERQLERRGVWLPAPLCYFTYFYVALAVLTFCSLWSMWTHLLRPTGFLDPNLTHDFVHRRMIEESDADSYRAWQEEASLLDWPYLSFFSLLCPVWLLATLGICAYHTRGHVKKILHYRRCCGSPAAVDVRDPRRRALVLHCKTIRIVALPLLYGLMSFQAVARMWGIVANTNGNRHFRSWEQRRDFLEDMYTETFIVGDIYEAYALLLFGGVLMHLVSNDTEEQVQSVYETLDGLGDPGRTSGSAARSASIDALATSARIFASQTKGLTISGIILFYLTCGMHGLYTLTVTAFGYYGWYPEYFGVELGNRGLLHTKEWEAKAHCFFYGAGFVASFAAIANIMQVERGFHGTLKEFRPRMKFWGTKVLVSIAFLQDLALLMIPPVCWWSEVRRSIFCATLLGFECFAISIIHLFAWPPHESWYAGDATRNYAGYSKIVCISDGSSAARSESSGEGSDEGQ
ncbi:unnamed protein product [Prorocentrum cordatum]|uniref:Uncharacterized protein n=2 Tax=Prorocentrum cordatum TaxID=2364126 RepID=A0ABN9SYV4_9DINO|nr:unnamed protein product [Polarella glacialis]